MMITVNGEGRQTEEATIQEFLDSINIQARMVVVERNGEIVLRTDYAATPLADRDVLEIVQMMAGG